MGGLANEHAGGHLGFDRDVCPRARVLWATLCRAFGHVSCIVSRMRSLVLLVLAGAFLCGCGGESSGETAGTGGGAGASGTGGAGGGIGSCDPKLAPSCVAGCNTDVIQMGQCQSGAWVCPAGTQLQSSCPPGSCFMGSSPPCCTSTGSTVPQICDSPVSFPHCPAGSQPSVQGICPSPSSCGSTLCNPETEYCRQGSADPGQPDGCVSLPSACGDAPTCDCLSGETCLNPICEEDGGALTLTCS